MARPGSLGDFHLNDGIDSKVRLNNGVDMPVFGLGTWQLGSGPDARDAVDAALALGYRLIDTAAMYENEAVVGASVRASGVPRSEVFVTTKLWNDDQGFETGLAAFERSRKELDVGPVDLYLIHWPVTGKRKESWKALQKLAKDGECRAVGVSNFTIDHLEELLSESDVVPTVNQVEFSPFLFQEDLLEFCWSEGIQLEAYAPLVRGKRMGDATIARIAAHHQATPAQVLLRWGLQHHVIQIPKTAHPERVRENAGVFKFELSAADMSELDRLNENFRTTWDPTKMP
jgi:methylglyoxal/glyoxal reductase